MYLVEPSDRSTTESARNLFRDFFNVATRITSVYLVEKNSNTDEQDIYYKDQLQKRKCKNVGKQNKILMLMDNF